MTKSTEIMPAVEVQDKSDIDSKMSTIKLAVDEEEVANSSGVSSGHVSSSLSGNAMQSPGTSISNSSGMYGEADNSLDLSVSGVITGGNSIVLHDAADSINVTFSTNREAITQGLEHSLCKLCNATFKKPRILSCLHVFCEPCLQVLLKQNDMTLIKCPVCKQLTQIDAKGIEALTVDYIHTNVLSLSNDDWRKIFCTSCKSKERAYSYCTDCDNFLCDSCHNAHRYMRCFELHRVTRIAEALKAQDHLKVDDEPSTGHTLTIHKPVLCNLHEYEHYKYYCYTCQKPVCNTCFGTNHKENHHCEYIQDAQKEINTKLIHLLTEAQNKIAYCTNASYTLATALNKLRADHECARSLISKSSDDYEKVLERIRDVTIVELNRLRAEREMKILQLIQSTGTLLTRLNNASIFAARVISKTNAVEFLFMAPLVACQLQLLLNAVPKCEINYGLKFINDLTKFEVAAHQSYGKLITECTQCTVPNICQATLPFQSFNTPIPFPSDRFLHESALTPKETVEASNSLEDYNLPLNSSLSNPNSTPVKLRFKFGSLGVAKGQFNSPHGFCLGLDGEIIVADTNNHRIQVFDKLSVFKFQFGISGKENGQLWYPRKIATMPKDGSFVICDRGSERSRMQVFSNWGHFMRKISIKYVDIVAGLAVTEKGQIVVVDSVSPTIFVISPDGELLRWFDCSEYMREPSDIAIRGTDYYVCDFKGHCVAVFNEDGAFLFRIGNEQVTCFPNGIDIAKNGDIFVGDSHGNRFHVASYSRDGLLLSEYECAQVKISRCCGLKIMSGGCIVTLAKNNHHVLVLETQQPESLAH